VSRRDLVAHTLQLFDPLRPRHPVFLLRLPPNTVQVQLTRRLVFALHGASPLSL
jgi:hypothetical protein